MIVSASRRTDVPALYSNWFMNRLREGFVYTRNPYNPNQCARISLAPEDVAAIVFWSKNPAPMLGHIEELIGAGYRFVFQFTLTGYPAPLEPGLPPVDERFETFKTLSSKIGPERMIWRYDPVIVSSLTPEEYIVENFGRLAGVLRGHTRRVMVSLAEFYGKVQRNLKKVVGVQFENLSLEPERAISLMGRLAELARNNSIDIFSCAEDLDLSPAGIAPGSCIDAALLEGLFGIKTQKGKDPSQRKKCRCAPSRDVGEYDTCTHGCVYCYANSKKALTDENVLLHDPEGPFLIDRQQDLAPRGMDGMK